MKIKLLILSVSILLFSCENKKESNIVKNGEKFLVEQMKPQSYESNYSALFDVKYKSDVIYMESIGVKDTVKYKKMMDEIYYLNDNPKEDSIIKYYIEVDYYYLDSTKKRVNENRLVVYNIRDKKYSLMSK
jgi:hypothetical protein